MHKHEHKLCFVGEGSKFCNAKAESSHTLPFALLQVDMEPKEPLFRGISGWGKSVLEEVLLACIIPAQLANLRHWPAVAPMWVAGCWPKAQSIAGTHKIASSDVRLPRFQVALCPLMFFTMVCKICLLVFASPGMSLLLIF